MADDDDWGDFEEVPQQQDLSEQPPRARSTDEWAAFPKVSAPSQGGKDEWADFPAAPSNDEWADFRTGAKPKEPENKPSPVVSALREAALHLPGAVGGFFGGAAGAAVGTLADPVLGPAGTIGGAIGGGIAGANIAQGAANWALHQLGFSPEDWQAADRAVNPTASNIGEFSTALVGTGPAKGAQWAARGIGALAGGGFEAGSELLQGQPLDPERIGLATATGIALPKVRGWVTNLEERAGRMLPGLRNVPGVVAPDSAAEKAAVQPAQEQQSPNISTTGASEAATPAAKTKVDDQSISVGSRRDYPAEPRTDQPTATPPPEGGVLIDPAKRAALDAKVGEGPAPPPEPPPPVTEQPARPVPEPITPEPARPAMESRPTTPAAPEPDLEIPGFLRRDAQNRLPERGAPPTAPEAPAAELAPEAEGRPASLGAAASPPTPAPTPSAATGPTLAERFYGDIRSHVDKLFDVGRDVQMMVSPMAAGSQEAMATAKDFANRLRRNRWDWGQVDSDIDRRFTPEQRKRMWDAADEESVLQQEGKTNPNMGLATLEPEERAAVEQLQARSQAAWKEAYDVGIVKNEEGLPAYTPRMFVNTATTGEGGPRSLTAIGRNLRTTTPQLRGRQHLMAEETEAAGKARLGEQAELARDIRTLPLATAKLEDAIAGRRMINEIRAAGQRTGQETVVEGAKPGPDWFTLDHAAFREWRPDLEINPVTGKMMARTDDAGKTIFKQVPLYVRGDFEGPLRSVLTQPSGMLYNAAMSLKGKTMGLIMNSPMIHNAVEWGRALPAMPGKVATFRVYFDGNRAKNNPTIMREAIDNGLVPIGKRFFNQDVSSIMEEPNLTPGRSWTAQVLAAVPGLFDRNAGESVKRAIDRAGDFWHNTLLWDRIGDLQMGLYTNMREDLLAKGVDPQSAGRVAAHWANRYAGALPQEAMSDAARKLANLTLFSRSFTLGNLGAMKDMLNGLPRDVRAQISRDIGSLDPKAEGYIKSMAQRKAIGIVMLDMGLMYVGNSLLQSGMNVMRGDDTLSDELRGYADRFGKALQRVREHPLSLLQPMSLMSSLSATSENEPSRQDRVFVGYTKDGTGIYARNPAGKIGEEFSGYLSGPLDMLRRKLGTIARPGWQILANDQGFGRKVYDPTADTPAGYLKNMGRIVQFLVGGQLPTQQLGAARDLITGQGDRKLAAMQTLGPLAGVTFSKGAPGGPPVGEMYAAQEKRKYAFENEKPDIMKALANRKDDPAGFRAAIKRMNELGVPPGLQSYYQRVAQRPASRLSPTKLQEFSRTASPEEKQRLQRMQRQQRAAQEAAQ
jgi:hypothetical protein